MRREIYEVTNELIYKIVAKYIYHSISPDQGAALWKTVRFILNQLRLD